MNVTDAISEWVDAWSASPSRPAAAFAVLDAFCTSTLALDESLIAEFDGVLRRKDNRWSPQLFVAKVLSRFRNFDRSLMVPMLQAAIDMPDPSSKGNFLTPCLYSFAAGDVIDWLVEKFANAEFAERVGIANLVYWLRSYPVDPAEMRRRQSMGLDVDNWLHTHDINASKLKDTIESAAKSTDNLVELYFYCLALSDRPHLFSSTPKDVIELKARIAGNAHYEDLLYDDLGWPRE